MNSRLYELYDPLTVTDCRASDLTQASTTVGMQIVFGGWTPVESFHEWMIQVGKEASFEKISFRMRYS